MKFRTQIALFFLLASCALFGKNSVHVFITAGQSNTDGRVKNQLLPDYIKAYASDTVNFETGAYPFCKITQNSSDGKFVDYWPKGRIKEGYWTYDAVAYYHIAKALQTDFYVIKYAVGGTSIQFPDCLPEKGRYWSADKEWLSQNEGASLLLALTKSIDAAIDSTLTKLEEGYQIDAFLWHQGESDDIYADKYYENLKAVFAYIRTHISEKTGKDYSQLPIVFGTVPKSNRHYREGVENAYHRIADEDANCYLIDMSGQTLQSDKTHFNEISAAYLGNKVFGILDQVLSLSNPKIRIARFKDDKQAAISYTFDDGLQEHYSLVFPKFKKLGFKGTFWVNGNTINQSEILGEYNKEPRSTWKQLIEMARQGQEISNHGWSHKNLVKCTEEEVWSEINRNDSIIEAKTGIRPLSYCYAGNSKNNKVIAMASKGRVATRLQQISIGSKRSQEDLNQWVQGLLHDHTWGVGMTHGITRGYDHFTDVGIFWNHIDKVKALEENIWIDTFKEISSYEKERSNFSFTTTKTTKGFILHPEISLDSTLFKSNLTAVIERTQAEKIKIKQDHKSLKVSYFEDKAVFSFNPFGGDITVIIN